MKIKIFVAREIQYFELGIFSFNSYVCYLTRGFIASTRAFNLLTCAFSLPTRAFNLVTRDFNLAGARVIPPRVVPLIPVKGNTSKFGFAIQVLPSDILEYFR